ncbi:MAG: molybdopterin-dependent oxidoreductase [Anaerolineae bacterium]|nr:molybdopterin-dependent oxidoreductase [Anaerolineae bacterium]
MSEVHLTINGLQVTAQSGQTILEAARAAGIDIPTLCHHPMLSNHGACRMCLVEVKGMRTLQTACTCPVAEGMEVQTETDEINECRKFSLELLFSERNHYCMFCQVSGDCELQALAYRYGLDHWRYPRPYEKMAVDASDPYIIMEPNRCILCTRCIRACAEIVANHTLGLRERGSATMVMADLDVPLGQSSCVECGVCLQVCPTGALIDARSAYGGHAEEVTHTQTTCMQCSVGCQLDVISRSTRILRIHGVWNTEPGGGLLCVDGRFRPLYETRERIAQPLVRDHGKLVPAGWTEALAIVAKKLKSGRVLGLASGATSNEALVAFAGLMAQVGGKAGQTMPALPTLGFGQPAAVQDILATDYIIVAGANPLVYQKVVGYLIRRAADRGTPVALIDVPRGGLEASAVLSVSGQYAATVTEQAAQAQAPLIIYSVGLKPGVARALKPLAHARWLALAPGRNSLGARAAGLAPLEGHDLTSSRFDVLFFLLGEGSEEGGVMPRLDGAFKIVQTAYRSPLAEEADVVLPAPIWAERSGHVTNLEGKTLPLNPVVPMPDGVRDEAEVLDTLRTMM